MRHGVKYTPSTSKKTRPEKQEVDEWEFLDKKYVMKFRTNNNSTSIKEEEKYAEIEEIEKVVNKLKNKKASGTDGMLNESIKTIQRIRPEISDKPDGVKGPSQKITWTG